jgi:outer membrane protein assembly factor BamB
VNEDEEMRLTCAAAIGALAIFCVTQGLAQQPEEPPLGSPDFNPSADHPVGWRGDGNGRYVAADPPLTWSRESKAVKELASQAKKPKDDDKGKPLSEGVIREWVTLGPVPIPEGKAAKDDFGTEEGKLAPEAGDKLGNLEWKSVALDSAWIDFWPMYGKAAKDWKGSVAYAHTWIYSAEGKPVFLHSMMSDTGKIWLNGKDLGAFTYSPGLQVAVHVQLPLEKGWNRLLLRVAPTSDTGWSRGVVQWHFNAAFFGTERDNYESKNILWTTPMPDYGPGVSSPILVGDKLFVTAEGGALVCLAAKDGKVLWARSSTYADAATPEERKGNPEAFAEIDKLTAKLNDSLKAYGDDPDKYLTETLLRGNEDSRARVLAEGYGKINKLLKKIAPEKYPGQSSGEAGESAPTPVSDGQNVYALYGTGVLACFDLAGNRKWTTVVVLPCYPEHGYYASPCLIGGKVIVKSPKHLGAVALDCKTGEAVTPMPAWKTEGLVMCSSPLPLDVGGEKLVVQSFGVITRVKDGKVLAKDFTPPFYNIADIVSPTFEGRTICSYVLAKNEDRTANRRFAFQTLPDTITDPLVMKETKECEIDVKAFPCMFNYDHCASPLLHQGLAYVVSIDGVLTVMDAAKGEIVYQKVLDLSPTMGYGPRRGGCSASPTLAGKYIYLWDGQGGTVVIEPGRTFKQVARNRIEQLYFRWGPACNECTISNPVFSGKRMFYRGEVNLYCIGEKDKQTSGPRPPGSPLKKP